MIQPTDEMIRALRKAKDDTGCGYCDTCLTEQVTAILTIVERNYVIGPRGAEPNPYADTDRARCISCGDPAEWHKPHGCEGDFGHCRCPGLVVAP